MTRLGTRGFYADLLGDDWAALPPVVRRLHEEGWAEGTVTIERAASGVSGLLARVAGLPPSGEDVPTRLTVTRGGEGQRWSRRFGGHAMVSAQRHRADGQMAERFGFIECRFRLKARARGLDYAPSGAALALGSLRLPLPRALSPRVEATTTAEEEGMRVDVTVEVPFLGRVLRYHGRVVPMHDPVAT